MEATITHRYTVQVPDSTRRWHHTWSLSGALRWARRYVRATGRYATVRDGIGIIGRIVMVDDVLTMV